MSHAAALADLAEREPGDAISEFRRAAERARSDGDTATEAAAWVEIARARRALGQIDLAEHALELALRAADPDGDAAADAHLVFASIMSLRGRSDAAFAHLAVAATSDDPTLARSAELQRAVLLQRTGKFAEALDIFDRVLPALRVGHLDSDIARVLANRGEIHARLGRFSDAEADFSEGAYLFDALDQPLRSAQTLQNLGWLRGVWGDLPGALATFDAVAQRLAESPHDTGALDVSRAEALLAAGLDREAAGFATRAFDQLVRSDCEVEAARALLLAARAQRRLDPRSAHRSARSAERIFAEQGADAWATLARLEALRSAERPDLDAVEALVMGLDGATPTAARIESAALAAEVAARDGDTERAERYLMVATELVDPIAPADVRLTVHLAAARVAGSVGRPNEVLRVVEAALDDLDRTTRSIDDSTIVRSAFRYPMNALQQLGVHACAQLGEATRAIGLGERAREIDLRPFTARVTPEAPDRRDARALHRQLHHGEPASIDLAETQARLEDLQRTFDAPGHASTLEPRVDIPAGLDLLSLLDDGETVHAVRVGTDAPELVALGPTSTLRALADGVGAILAAAARTASRPLPPLDRHLAALDGRLAGLVPPGRSAVGISAPGWLATMPWRLLPSWRGRSVTVVPSLAWLARTERPTVTPAPGTGRTVIVAGPDLAQADAEAQAVADVCADHVLLTGRSATPGAVVRAMEDADSLHLVAHGRLDRGNPAWSTISLVGGELTVERLRATQHTPRTVVLSACHTAPSPGDDLLGLTGALFASGTRTVIASSGPLPDSPDTIDTMRRLHLRLSAGTGAGTALSESATNPLIDALLVCLGVP